MALHQASFTKSKLVSCLQCPKRLWLELYRPKLAEESPRTEAVFATGNEVGTIARSLLDPESKGTTIDVFTLGVTKALARTAELLKERKPIFEAGFTANGASAFADALLPVRRRSQPTWRMVEVKSSASVKDYQRNDVAIQAYVARKSGLPLSSIAIAHVDRTWVYPGDGDYQGLLTEVDLTDEAFVRGKEVEGWIADARKVAAKRKEPALKTGPHCNDPFECGFKGYCNSQEPTPRHSSEWFPNKGKELKRLIYEDGLIEMKDIPDAVLNDVQLRIKANTLANTVHFDAKGAAAALKPLGLPAFFLDFETISLTVPIWKGTRPFQKIPFQFNVQRLGKNRRLDDRAFLDLSGEDPSRKLAEALVKACEESGPVYVYNAGFERSVIQDLADRFPKLKTPLMKINTRMVDLMPLAKKHYYHRDMQGSWSIKNVLPTIAPDLDYENLEEVQSGSMVQAAFEEAIRPGTSPSRREEIRSQLLDYCGLDTYSMVRIWQHFTGHHDWRL
jgi:CRISPR/Cas system-associated exonuclease Cas4 (RecB family)